MIIGSLSSRAFRRAETASGRRLHLFVEFGLGFVVITTNLISSVVVLALALLVLPLSPAEGAALGPWHYVTIAGIYLVVAIPLGFLMTRRRRGEIKRWLISGDKASPRIQRRLLYIPFGLFGVQLVLWSGASVLFGLLSRDLPGAGPIWVSLVVFLTGLTSASCTYLLSERMLRPLNARAFHSGAPRLRLLPGITFRSLMAWSLGSGVPVAGLIVVGIVALTDSDTTTKDLAISMIVLGGIALSVGFLTVTAAARTTAEPIKRVVRALAAVQEGKLDQRIQVFDGTEIGRLQMGFNEMAAGLRERERIRAAFGVYVDPDVAEHVLHEGSDLAGEQVEVSIMFLDIRDFTGLSERSEVKEVLATINHLFDLAVPIIQREGGHVDKFVGDGLLAVFGAPRRLDNHAHSAVRAAVAINRAVRDDARLEISVGIGVNSGSVLAGNVGGGGRLEFSVIGDAVNVAARIESATRQTGDDVLVSQRTRELLGETDWEWAARPEIALKGKSQAATLYSPLRDDAVEYGSSAGG